MATNTAGCAPWNHIHLWEGLEVCTGDHLALFEETLIAIQYKNASTSCPHCMQDCEYVVFKNKVSPHFIGTNLLYNEFTLKVDSMRINIELECEANQKLQEAVLKPIAESIDKFAWEYSRL